jgi:AraC family transcriptional regulator, alkane utilization regulator
MPKVLTETPLVSFDLLSDLLDSMHLSGTVLFNAAFHEPWAVTTPGSARLAQMMPFKTEHIIPFHVVAAGGCWLEMNGHEPVWIQEGDAILMPYGDSHVLRGRETVAPVQIAHLMPPGPWNDIPLVAHGGTGYATTLVCGFVQCDELLFHPILRHLPAQVHVRPATTVDDHWLAATIRHTADEAGSSRAGARTMLPRLTELMFIEILRKYMQGVSAEEVGWFAAYNDAVTGAALKLLHAQPLREWTVDALAREVGVSRTVLAESFTRRLAEPPMKYLARWRMQLAAQALKGSNAPVKAIAELSGYESEAAFSRAFSRRFGLPPSKWRSRQSPQGSG